MQTRTLSAALIAAATIATVLLSVPAAASANAVLPTYTCDNVVPTPPGPETVGFGNCVASNGAPATGVLAAADRNLVDRTTSATLLCKGAGEAFVPDIVILTDCQ
ncbi:hypothetical protein [Spongiactinospora sp. TRM90649]|uniref:hypothetical protein n=1 Tax=Spongiactinospora sp. TRM90649 TaxID=3031114 RepID=UPI0023F84972|nr:hypothetical protein [Spongiactinospora sp. TRM90649]MDF5753924.1 hypothetical protein [Spongiactinospora sp. TRM90649]